MQNKTGKVLGGAVYVLPNLLTSGNLFFGFLCMIRALEGHFTWAAVCIFIAALFDMLDGRVARLTKGTSEFGVQYDSLCDAVSFGVAPAFMMYQFGLFDVGRLGWASCFIYMACGTLRLARFNVQSSIGKAGGDFTGLPIPMAAAAVAAWILLMDAIDSPSGGYDWLPAMLLDVVGDQRLRNIFMLFLAPALGLCMVSNFAYRSHKTIRFKGIKPFRMIVLVTGLIGLLTYQTELVVFILSFGYALSGLVEGIAGWRKPIEDDEIFHSTHEDHAFDGHDDHVKPTSGEGHR
jgi:CDP-diacylglycerol--serine O-phosphatidyltransferase